jgi:hemolysin activation/secretion protein
LDASYPLLRSPKDNLSLLGNWDHKKFSNQANQTVTSQYELFVGNVVLSGNAQDAWMGGGAFNYSLGLTRGLVNLGDSPNQQADLQSAQTAGLYSKANFNLSRQQSLNSSWTFLTSLNAQVANRNLDSSEKIYLGGASGVRAYPSNEGSGSNGQTLSFDLKKNFWDRWSLAGFYDWGHVMVYQSNQSVTGLPLTGLNDFTLKGAGLSLAWQNFNGTDVKLTLARRILTNPIANASTGADTDGTLRLNRVWINANVAF